jgi:hypothetical protein
MCWLFYCLDVKHIQDFQVQIFELPVEGSSVNKKGLNEKIWTLSHYYIED